MSAGTIIRDRKGHSIFLDDHVEVTVGARLEIRYGVVTGITRKNVTVSYTRSDGNGVTTGRFPVRTGAGASIVDGVIFRYSLTRDFALNGGGTYQLDAKGDILIPVGQVAEALTVDGAIKDLAAKAWATHPNNPNRQRRAVVKGDRNRREEVEAYLPSNYALVLRDGQFFIEGHDNAGWTLDGYVIPRLASGLIFAEEVSA